MEIDDKLISYLEELSCLTLSDEERSSLKDDLNKILNDMARLGEIDTAGVAERSHPFDNTNVFRADEVQPSLDRESVLKNAPKKTGGMFVAPKTIE